MFSPHISRVWTRSQRWLPVPHDTAALFRPVPTFWGKKFPFALNLLVLLEAHRKSRRHLRRSKIRSQSFPIHPWWTRRLSSTAFNTLKNADSRGILNLGAGGGSSQGESELFTVRRNTITSVRPYEAQSGTDCEAWECSSPLIHHPRLLVLYRTENLLKIETSPFVVITP